MNSTDIGAALLLGLAGSGHCLGMCGGIAIALRGSVSSSRWLAISYHGGRLMSYGALGALVGSAAGAINLAAWTISLRFGAGLLLIAMGLHTLKLWFGIVHLEQFGGVIWRPIAPLAQRYMPPSKLHHGLALGILWGFMPCGLIYSALTWSAAAGASAFDSGVLMAAFGLGTLPSMLSATLLGQKASRFLSAPPVRTGLGLLLILAGLWSLWLTGSHLDRLLGGGHGAGGHSQTMEHRNH